MYQPLIVPINIKRNNFITTHVMVFFSFPTFSFFFFTPLCYGLDSFFSLPYLMWVTLSIYHANVVHNPTEYLYWMNSFLCVISRSKMYSKISSPLILYTDRGKFLAYYTDLTYLNLMDAKMYNNLRFLLLIHFQVIYMSKNNVIIFYHHL